VAGFSNPFAPLSILLVMLETICVLERQEHFLREIKGSQVVIPDLYALFPGWKFNINRNYDTVKNQTNRWLERCIF
jgi:hypothetical protein